MPIVGAAAELPGSPTLKATLNQRSYERKFLVQTDDKNTGAKTVCAAAGIPRLFEYYNFGTERDIYALCREIESERIQDGSLFWHVTAHYSTPEPRRRHRFSGTHRDSGENPLLQLPEIQTSGEKWHEPIFYVYDITKPLAPIQPCKATNGEVFIPAPVRDACRLHLVITRNEPIDVAHPSVDLVYTDAVNNDIFWGCPPGTWKVHDISTKRETKQMQDGSIFPFLKVTYKFEARPTWDLLILDSGTYYLNPDMKIAGDPGKQKFLIDGHPGQGQLDGKGNKLGVGLPPVFLRFRVYAWRNFAPLNLPQSFAAVA